MKRKISKMKRKILLGSMLSIVPLPIVASVAMNIKSSDQTVIESKIFLTDPTVENIVYGDGKTSGFLNIDLDYIRKQGYIGFDYKVYSSLGKLKDKYDINIGDKILYYYYDKSGKKHTYTYYVTNSNTNSINVGEMFKVHKSYILDAVQYLNSHSSTSSLAKWHYFEVEKLDNGTNKIYKVTARRKISKYHIEIGDHFYVSFKSIKNQPKIIDGSKIEMLQSFWNSSSVSLAHHARGREFNGTLRIPLGIEEGTSFKIKRIYNLFKWRMDKGLYKAWAKLSYLERRYATSIHHKDKFSFILRGGRQHIFVNEKKPSFNWFASLIKDLAELPILATNYIQGGIVSVFNSSLGRDIIENAYNIAIGNKDIFSSFALSGLQGVYSKISTLVDKLGINIGSNFKIKSVTKEEIAKLTKRFLKKLSIKYKNVVKNPDTIQSLFGVSDKTFIKFTSLIEQWYKNRSISLGSDITTSQTESLNNFLKSNMSSTNAQTIMLNCAMLINSQEIDKKFDKLRKYGMVLEKKYPYLTEALNSYENNELEMSYRLYYRVFGDKLWGVSKGFGVENSRNHLTDESHILLIGDLDTISVLRKEEAKDFFENYNKKAKFKMVKIFDYTSPGDKGDAIKTKLKPSETIITSPMRVYKLVKKKYESMKITESGLNINRKNFADDNEWKDDTNKPIFIFMTNTDGDKKIVEIKERVKPRGGSNSVYEYVVNGGTVKVYYFPKKDKFQVINLTDKEYKNVFIVKAGHL